MATLKARFEELIHLNWREFVELENNKSSTVDDSVLTSLIRTCADTDDIAAIKLAFDRIEGLQAVLIEVKVPKFYTRYINAKEVEPTTAQIEAPDDAKEDDPSKYDPATAKLRETLLKMRSMPQDVIRAVRLYKRRIDKGTDNPKDDAPSVKAVIVANLLKNVQKGRFRAVELVFDQIDGKLPKAIELLGGQDVYIDDDQTLTAPAHSILGEDGIYYAEDLIMTAQWLRGFARSQKGLEMLAEGLDND